MATTESIERARSILNPAPFVELRQSFTGGLAVIGPFADQLMRFVKFFMRKLDTANETEDEVAIALHEALENAVIHGNHENPERQVYVSCRCSMDGEVLITVRDEGAGFDTSTGPDPSEDTRLVLTHGRGLQLMRALMDEVSFDENGTVVRIRKRMKPQIAGDR